MNSETSNVSNYKNLNQGRIDTQGNVLLGDNSQIITNIYQSADYHALTRQRDDLLKRRSKLRVRVEKYPGDDDFKSDLNDVQYKLTKIMMDIEDFKRNVLKLAEDFQHIPINTERLKLALQYFEGSDYQAARAVLDAEGMIEEQDALLGRREDLQEQQEAVQKQLDDKAQEFLMLAELTSIDYSLDEQRIPKTCEYYIRVLKSGRPPRQLTERPHLAAMALWCKKLSLENPDTKLPNDIVDLVITYNNREYISKDVVLGYAYDTEGYLCQPEFTMELRLSEKYREKSVYCHILFFDGCTRDIYGSVLSDVFLLHGKNPSAKIFEGQSIPVKIKDELYEQGINKIHDYIKLIISEEKFDPIVMEQSGNEDPINRKIRREKAAIVNTALQYLINDSNSLSLKLEPTGFENHDWFAKTISLTIVRGRLLANNPNSR